MRIVRELWPGGRQWKGNHLLTGIPVQKYDPFIVYPPRDDLTRICSLQSDYLQSTTCDFCEETFPGVSAMKDHQDNSCPEKIVSCGQAGNGCMWKGRKVSLEDHVDKCPYESVKGFFAIHSAQMVQLSKDNNRLRHRTEELEGTIRTLRQELEWAKIALGPWYRPMYPERQSMPVNYIRCADGEDTRTGTGSTPSQTIDPVGGTFLPEPIQNPGNDAAGRFGFFNPFSSVNQGQDRVPSVHATNEASATLGVAGTDTTTDTASDATHHSIEWLDFGDLNRGVGESSASGSGSLGGSGSIRNATGTVLSPGGSNLQPASTLPPVLDYFPSEDVSSSRTRSWQHASPQPASIGQNASPSIYSAVSITVFAIRMRLRDFNL